MLTISGPCKDYPGSRQGLRCNSGGKDCDQCGWNPREDRNRRQALRSGNIPLQIRRKTAQIDSEPETPTNMVG